ncbi:DUF11 domain-containing protein [Actinokineospora enzanensis]|uniref:DUF11 domain-containing protein n=1 Tax=Actinokineospora enzanensis TaxID=155975 RepID=UPI000373CE96|nr:DUF11 domain-containing protein [Actinokineospora enzanensis]
MGAAYRTGFPRRTRAGVLCLAMALLATFVPIVAAPVAEASVRQNFDAVYSSEENGAITLTGASSMDCPTATSGCTSARTGSATTTSNNNNVYNMAFVDVDSDASTSNSSTATLNMPTGSTVLYARLIWGGRTVAGTNGVVPTKAVNTARFRAPGATAYTTYTATTLIQPTALVTSDGGPYQASIDVTSVVKAAGGGTYAVADIGAATGMDRYAGWSLVVAYRNPTLPLRNLRVFEGFADITSATGNNSVDIPVSGFLTPTTGNVNASVGVVAWEGDYGTTGDALKLAGTTLSDATRPANNFFDSRISDAGVDQTGRSPGNLNNFGVDIGRIATTNVLSNGSTSATINLTSSGDSYYPGIVTSQIDLFTPTFNAVSKTVTNLNGNNPAQPGDTLEYRLTFTNSGGDYADASVVRDALATGLTYLPGSLVVDTDSGSTTGTRTDAPGDDSADYTASDRTVRFRVGTGSSATTGGSIGPNGSVAVRFRATVNRAAAGSTIVNTPALDYRARTLNRSYSFAGNDVNTAVSALADMSAAKTAATPSQNAGQTVTYTISAVNNGPNDAAGVTLTDTLPTGTTFVSATPPSGTCTASGQTVTCAIGAVTNGTTVSVPVVARINADTTGGTVINSVRVSATTADDVAVNNTATAPVAVTRSADLGVTTSLTGPVVPGTEQATLTTTVTNAGPSTADSVVLSIPVPDGTYVVWASDGCVVTSGTLICTVGTLPPGQTYTATAVLGVVSGYTKPTLAVNSSVSSPTTDPNTADNTATATAMVVPTADIVVTQTASDPNPIAGNRTNYTVTVYNDGPSDAQNVVITDPLPAGVTIVSASPQSGTCATTNGTVSCQLGTVPAGGTTTVNLRVAIAPDRAAGPLANTASGTTSTQQDNTANDAATVTTTVQRVSDLALTKTAIPTPVVVGAPIAYTLTVTNNGPSAADAVVVNDPLPTGLTATGEQSTQGTCTITGQTVNCALGTVAAGATASVTITADTPGTVPAAGFTNTATVASASTDPNPANNTATHVANVTAQADITVAETVAGTVVNAGQSTRYTATVTNNGPSVATGVTFTQAVPAGFAIGTITPSTGTCQVVGGQVQCAIGNLASGANATVAIDVNVPSGQATVPVNATATASSAIPDPTQSNNTATTPISVRAQADVRFAGLQAPGTFRAGESFTRTFAIGNAGPSDAQGVTVQADLPVGVLDLTATVNGITCAVNGGRISCPIGTLTAGQVVNGSVSGRIAASSPPGPREFSATISSSTPDPTPANNQVSASTAVTAYAGLGITQTVNPTPLVAGAQATYLISANNTGPSDAVNVAVTQNLPAGVTLVSAVSSLGACTTTATTVSCTVDRLPAGGKDDVTVVVAVSPTASGSIAAEAQVQTDTPSPGGEDQLTTLTTPVVQNAELSIIGGALQSPVRAGTAQTYTLTVANSGPSAAANVTFSDTLPDGMVLLPGGLVTQAGTCTPNPDGKGATCALGTVAPGSSVAIVLTALVPADTPAGTVLTDTAAVGSPTADPTPDNRSVTIPVTVSTAADLTVSTTSTSTNAGAGQDIRYDITVANHGPSTARTVTLTDPLPAGTTFVSADTGCALAGAQVQCALGDLAQGAITTKTITLHLAPDYPSPTVVNTATATSPTSDPNPADNAGTITHTVNYTANLAATNVITSGPVVAGSPVTYHATITNNGPAQAPQLVLTDPMPAGTTYVSAVAGSGGTCVFATGAVRCSWPSLALGATVAADITVRLSSTTPAGGALANTVTASSAVPDPDAADSSATATGTVGAVADLAVTQVLTSGPPIAGGRVTWQAVITNNGPSSAYGVATTDPAPAGVRYTAASSTVGTCTFDSAGAQCSVGTIPSGGTATVTLTGTLAPDYTGTAVTNTVTVAATSTDPNTANNTASAVSDAGSSADVKLAMTAAPEPVVPGRNVSWTITAGNDGPSIARGVVITDDLPTGVTPQPVAGCSITGRRVTCPVGDIAPGATTSVTLSGLLAANFSAASLRNTATASSGTADPDVSSNSATTTSTPNASANLAVQVGQPATAVAGQDASWPVRVTDAGPSDATGTVVTVSVPAYLSNARASWPGGSCTISGATATCALGVVGAGQTTEVTLTGTIDPAYTGPLTVGAEVTAQTADPNLADNTTNSVSATSQSADLIASVTPPAAAVPGTVQTWVLGTRNLGPSTATGVVLTNTLPDGLSGVTATTVTGTCTVAGKNVTCQVGDLVPGATAMVSISGLLAANVSVPTLVDTGASNSTTPDPNTANNSASGSSPVTPNANLHVAAAVTQGPVQGAAIAFVVEVSNTGPSDAQSVTVTDTLPSTISGLTADTPQGSCTITGQVLTCALGTLAAGAPAVPVTIRGMLADGAGNSVTTSATASSPTTEVDTSDNTGTVTASATESANVAVTVDAPASVTAGTGLVYTVTVRNAGPSTAHAVAIDRVLPAALTGATTDNPACPATGGTCVLGDIAPGASVVLHISGTVDPAYTGEALDSRITASATSPDPDSRDNAATTRVAVTRTADLGATISVDPSPVVAGRPLLYTATITSQGPSAVNGVVTFSALPDGTEVAGPITADRGTCSVIVRSVVCDLGTLPPGTPVVVRIPVALSASFAEPTLTNTISVQAPTPDPNPANNSASAAASVSALADFKVGVAAPAAVTPGELTSWDITVDNHGPSDAPATVSQTLPLGVDEITAVSSQGTCALSGQTVTCDLGTVAANGRITITVHGRLAPDITAPDLTTTAILTSPVAEPDPNQSDGRSASVTSTVTPSANVFVEVVADQPTLTPGTTATWTVTATNAGPSTARGVVVGATPPGVATGASLVVVDHPGITCDATLHCAVGDLPPGKEGAVRFTLTATLPAKITDAVLDTDADVTATTPDPNPGDNTATASTPVSASADLRLTLAVAPQPIVAGGPVTITATLANDGPSTAPGTTFTMPVPVGVDGVTIEAPPGALCDTVNQTVFCTVGDVPPGQVQVVVRGTVSPTYTDDSLSVTASTDSDVADPNPQNNTVTTVSQSSVSADLGVSLAVDPAAPVAGAPVTVTAKVRANGPSTAADVTFRLPVPDELRDVQVTAPAGVTCDATVSCTLGTLTPGTEIDIVLRGTVAPDFGGDMVLTGTVDAASPDDTPDNDSATVTSAVGGNADLSVTTAVDPMPLTAGSPVTLTSTIHNAGPSTAGKTAFTLPVPAGFTDVEVIAPNGVTCDDTVACQVGVVNPGQDIQIVVRGRIAPDLAAGPVTLASTVTSAVDDANQADNTAQVATSVGIAADVRVGLVVDPMPLVAGSPVTATATVHNDGPSTATGVGFSLPVPAGFTEVVVAAPNGVTCDNTVSCTVGTLAPGAEAVITVRGRIAPDVTAADITLTGSATTTSADPSQANNSVTATTGVGADAGLAMALTVDPAQVTPGTPVTATATLHNGGPSTAAGATFTLPVPAGLTGVTVTAPPGVVCDAVTSPVTCTVGSIAPNTDVVITVRGTVDPAYAGPDITFTATGGSQTPDANPADDTITVTRPVAAVADLSATADITQANPVAGSPIDIVATVVNNGPSTAVGATLNIPVPAGVQGVTVTAPPGVTCDGGVFCTVGTLAPGASAQVTLHGTVAPDVTAPISVTATATSQTGDPTPGNNSATDTGTTGTTADLAFTAQVSPDPITAGTAVTVGTHLVNNGPSTATGVTVTVPVPAGLTDVTVTAPPGVTCDNTVACTVGTLAPGASVDVVIHGTVAPNVTAPLTITGNAASPVGDPNTADNAFTATGTVSTAADLSAVVAFAPGAVTAGSPVSAKVTLHNAGPSTAAGTTVSVPVPAGLTDVSVIAPNGVTCDNTIACTLGDLAPDATVEITVNGRVAPAFTGDLTLTATAATTATDPSTADNTGTATSQVATSADLKVTSTLDPTALVAGSPFTFATTIDNSGPSTATGVTFTLPVPAGVTGVSVVAPPGVTCDNTVTCTVGAVTPGTPVRIEVTGTVDPAFTGNLLAFTGTVASPTPDPDTAGNAATITANVTQAAGLRVVVTPDPLSATSGAPITITASARNTGPSTATSVTLALPVPAGLENIQVIAPAGVTCDATVACTVGMLAPNTQVDVVVRGTIASDFAGNELILTGSANTATNDPDQSDNSVTVPVQVNATADLSATTTVDPATLTAGSPVTVTTTIHNTGPSAAVGTTFTMPIPDGLTTVAVTPPAGVTCDIALARAGMVTCAVGSVDAGADLAIVVTGTVDPAFTGSSLTIATSVTSPTPDPDAAGNGSSTTVPVGVNADLASSFTIDPATLTAGSAFTVAAAVRNAGPSTATGVTFTVPIPAGVENVTVTAPAGVTCDSTVACTIGTITPGTTVTVTVQGRVAADFTGTSLPFSATASSATPDTTPNNNTATYDAQSGAAAGLSVATVFDPTAPTAGSPITIRSTLHNDGPSTAAGVTFALPVPAGLTNVTVVAPAGVTCDSSVSCTVGAVAPGTDVVVEVRGTVVADLTGTLSVTTTAATTTPDLNQTDNSATASAAVGVTTDLGVSVVADPTSATAGSPLALTTTVSNTGPSTGKNVTVTVSVPAGLTNVTVDAPPGVTCDTTVVCTIDTIAAGADTVITVRGTVLPTFTGPNLSFTGAVSSAAGDPNGAGNTTTVDVPVSVAAGLGVVSVTGPTTATAGTPVTVTTTLHNAGPSTAQGATLTLPVPAGLTNVTVTAPTGVTCDNTVSCTLGDVAPNADVVITVQGTVDSAYTGPPLVFTATAASPSADPTPGDNAGTATVPVSVAADLALTTALDSTTLTAGNAVRQTATLHNNGPSASAGVTLSLPVPPGVTTVTVTAPPGVTCDTSVSCTVPPLAPGATVDIVVGGTVDPAFTGDQIIFTGQVITSSPDPGAQDNTAEVTAQVGASADLAITAALTPATLTPGSPAQVTATVRNTGPSTAAGVTFTLPVPAGVTNVIVHSPAGVTCDNTVTCTIGDLAPGASVDLTVDAVLAPNANATSMTFTATAASPTADPAQGNDSVVLTANVSASADLWVRTTFDPTALTAGNPFAATTVIGNTGPSTATGTTFTFPIPAGVDPASVSVTAPPGVTCDNTVTCTIGDVPPGTDITIVVGGRVAPTTTTAPTFTATVSSPTPGQDPADRTVTITPSLTVAADLGVAMALDPAKPTAGTAVAATVTLSNAGPSTATGAVVTIPVPAGLTGVQFVTPAGVSCDPTGTCVVDSLAGGATLTIVLRGTVAPNTTADLVFSATAASPFSDTDPADNTVTVTAPVTTAADLVTAAAITSGLPTAGSPVAITASVTNDGPSTAAGTTLAVPLPAGLADIVVTAPPGVTCDTTVTCTIGDLAPGTKVTIGITADIPPAYDQPFDLTATSTSTTPDPDDSDNSVVAAGAVQTVADLVLTATLGPDPLEAGGPATVTASVVNNGPSTARDVTISVPVPAGLTDIAVTAPPGVTCDTTVTCVVDALDPGATVQVTVTGTIPADQIDDLASTVTVDSAAIDPDTDTNTVALTRPVGAQADLSVIADFTADQLTAGSPAVVRATARNAGPATATKARLSLGLPGELQNLVITAPPGITCDTTVACDLGDLAPGAEVTIEVRGVFDADVTGDASITAQVESRTHDPNPDNDSIFVSQDVNSSTDVALTNTGPGQVYAGADVTWTLGVHVGGPSQARDVIVVDTLPAGVTLVSADPACTLQGSTLRCLLGAMAPNTDRTLTVTGHVDPAFTGAQLSNAASVTSTVADTNLDNNTAQAVTSVVRYVDLGMTKTLSPDPVVPGGQATFTLEVANYGASTGTNVVITDPIGTGLTPVSATANQGTCAIDGQLVTCAPGSITPDGTVIVTIVVDVDAGFVPDEISNTATVVSDVADSDGSDNTATVAGASAPQTDLAVVKTADRPDYGPGDPISWLVSITNTGVSTARGVVLTDRLPASVDQYTLPNGCAVTAGSMICTLGDIAAGDTQLVNVSGVVRADAPVGTIDNSAAVASSTADSNTANNTSTVSSLLDARADLRLTKTADGQIVPGTDAAWLLAVTNDGNAAARDVVVTDALPAGATFVSATGGTCTATANVVSCALDPIAPGTTTTVRLLTAIAADYDGASISNSAVVTSSTPDPDGGNDSDAAVANISRKTSLSVTKTADKAKATIGDTITWVVTVANAGPSDALAASVTDELPAGVTLLSAVTSAGTYDPATGSWRLDGVDVNERPTLVVTARVDKAGSLVNVATVSAQDVIDSADNDDTAQALTDVAAANNGNTDNNNTGTSTENNSGTSTDNGTSTGTQPTTATEATDQNLSYTGFALWRWLSIGLLLTLAGVALVTQPWRRGRRS